MDDALVAVHLFDKVVRNGDEHFPPVLVRHEQRLGALVIDGADFPHIATPGIVQPKPNNLVVIKFVPLKRREHLQGQVQFLSLIHI